MVDHALSIADRAERQRCANTIINIMGGMFPHLRDVPDFKHKLWDHLAIMSGFQLDIDYPYEVVRKESLETKPAPLPYPQGNIRYRHYGRFLEDMVKKAMNYPEGPEKKRLAFLIANHMKRDFLNWNKDGVEDQKILDDLREYSQGAIDLKADGLTLFEAPRFNNNYVPRRPQQNNNQRRMQNNNQRRMQNNNMTRKY